MLVENAVVHGVAPSERGGTVVVRAVRAAPWLKPISAIGVAQALARVRPASDPLLSAHGFLRVHRNALVRLDAVREVSADDELVLGCSRRAISRRRMEEVRRALGLP